MTPDCIRYYQDIQDTDESHYPGSRELMSIGSPFGKIFGFQRLGIHHEVLPPGRRTSWPHAEEKEDEFIFVVEGTPDVWLDGDLYRLKPGDGVGFPAGTGQAHCFLNNTDALVRLLVVGDRNRPDNRFHYPLHAAYDQTIGKQWWNDAPPRKLGPHDGLPDALRASNGPF
ncbi:cupin domain-containing protein [Telmatospirillum sp.]|uniref:cupin domain-containing protein n=1 Tax=Telmatospirillum sp. TaxID=2079197 RepID=UPI00283D9D63|nr:cupin domain-containing protein [Telmatospirillum sp.]MDR3435172.1 cupin domain-containing protein [Telmatospirillum sp.]